MSNLIAWFMEYVCEWSAILSMTELTFGISALEFFLPLVAGKTLSLIVEDRIVRAAGLLKDAVEAEVLKKSSARKHACCSRLRLLHGGC